MDEDMLTRVCQKYEKMGHSVQLKTNIIKLNQIKSDTCLQEEVIFDKKKIHSIVEIQKFWSNSWLKIAKFWTCDHEAKPFRSCFWI